MAYRIDLGAWGGIFAVPCSLVDRQLKLAGEAQLKALLYILRHSDRAVEPDELAHVCGISVGDAVDAVEYWRQQGLVICESGQLAIPKTAEKSDTPPVQPEAVCASAEIRPAAEEAPAAAAPVVTVEDTADAAPKPKAKERIRYAYNECAEMMNGDSELRHMLSVLEGLLAKNLNHTEISVFITLVKWYGLPPSCVALLVEYCREIGRPSIAYIETTGIGWVNEEITTIEQVDQKINQLRAARSAWAHLRTVLDLAERAPTKKEQEYSSAWITDWHMPDELILLAYERCVNNKGKLSMNYMNGILSKWHKNGIVTAEQANAESASGERTASGAATPKDTAAQGMYQPTYDKSEIEALLDEDWLDEA